MCIRDRPWDATSSGEEEGDAAYDEASDADFFQRVAAAEAAETSAEDSSADSERDSERDSDPDRALPPKLPENKPKGKGKWAKLRED